MSRPTKEALLAELDLATEEVKLSTGAKVLVRELLAGERLEVHEASQQDRTLIPPLLVRHACINDDGTALFSAEDVEALRRKSPRKLDEIARVVMRLSGIAGEEKDPEGEASGQSVGSSTD